MKTNFYLLLTFLISYTPGFSQELLPLFEEGKYTSTVYFNPDQESGSTTVLEVKGDSVVNGQCCAKLYRSDYNSEIGQYTEKNVLEWLAYEKDGKVYVKNIGKDLFSQAYSDFRLCFDYHWKAGDKVNLETFFYQDSSPSQPFKNAYGIIDEVTEVVAPCGKVLKKWSFTAYVPWNENYTESKAMVFLEGVGLLHHYGFNYGFGITGYYGSQSLQCVRANGDLLYDSGDGPIWTGLDRLLLPSSSTDIYDLTGRKLAGKPTRGIYLQQGKKYISK